MSRPPYPHRCIGGTPIVWACRCGARPDIYSAETARDGWGSDCPIALREALAETEARAERAEAERDAARKDLAECYRLSGADPDGDGWEHLWQTAVAEVRELRESYDELRRELAESGSRYRDHLPAAEAEVEPVQLDRPMVMAEVVEERSCFTCRHDWSAGRPPFHYCNCHTTDDVQDYMAGSGAETSTDGLPTDRTVRCPGWSPKEPT